MAVKAGFARGLPDLCHSVTVLMARWRSMVMPSIPIRIETDEGNRGFS